MIAAIEVGGTFTDFVLIDEQGKLMIHKAPSTPANPAESAIRGLDEMLVRAGRKAESLKELLHGSTVAANMLIERRESKTALLVTKGFRDVLAIQRASKGFVYNMRYRKPKPLVTTPHVFELDERVSAAGEVVSPLDPDQLSAVLRDVVAGGYRSVAVCLLHSYANDVHERMVAEAIGNTTSLYVTLSSEIAPEYREYERTSTTVVSAFLRPSIDAYLSDFTSRLTSVGYGGAPLIMQSNGGVVPVDTAKRLAANMFLSGPAAAASGAAVLARRCNIKKMISIDVGGTSSDLCLITDGQPATTVNGTSNYTIDGHPLNIMMTDIVTLGAGGGSIAQIDAGGILQVGPRSAGAKPGPACYGHGGTEFTLSDAMLLMGLLDADAPLPGGIRLRPDLALDVALPLCDRLGLTPLDLAEKVYRIAAVNMAQALRRTCVKRGVDPREFVLLPCGGVGPMIATAVAEEVGMDRVLVPPFPGIFSALGLAVADLRMDYVRGETVSASTKFSGPDLVERFASLKERAVREFESFGIDIDRVGISLLVDARYRGQGYELRIEVPEADIVEAGPKAIDERFHRLHHQQYGLRFDHRPVEIVSFRLTATHPRTNVKFEIGVPSPEAQKSRKVVTGAWDGEWTVVDRSAIPQDGIHGPVLVVEATTTTVVPPGWEVKAAPEASLSLVRTSN